MQIDDIVNKIFTRSFMGYDMREVDSFLDEIIDKLERYEAERREMLTAMEYLLDKLENGGTLPERKKQLNAGTDAPAKRGRGPRLIRGAQAEKPEPAASSLAEEAVVAVELELQNDAPDPDELFPEIFETLIELNIPTGDADDKDEKSAS